MKTLPLFIKILLLVLLVSLSYVYLQTGVPFFNKNKKTVIMYCEKKKGVIVKDYDNICPGLESYELVKVSNSISETYELVDNKLNLEIEFEKELSPIYIKNKMCEWERLPNEIFKNIGYKGKLSLDNEFLVMYDMEYNEHLDPSFDVGSIVNTHTTEFSKTLHISYKELPSQDYLSLDKEKIKIMLKTK